jgi:hypothetical protein
MSSATSIDNVRLTPDAAGARAVRPRPDQSLRPWQFFVLAGLGCATAATFLARGQGVIVVVLLTMLMASVTAIGIAVLRAVGPLVSPADDRTVMIGQRTRAALEREKTLVLRSIKELEFDHAMGKVADADFNEMAGRLRARASRLIRQLDAGAGYREQIERDLAARLEQSGRAKVPGSCSNCATLNDADARFCKACGSKLCPDPA